MPYWLTEKLIHKNQTWIRPLSLEFVILNAEFYGFLTASMFLFEVLFTFGNFTI